MSKKLDEEMTAWLRSKEMENATRYAGEGRRFRSDPTEALKERWVLMVKRWADNPLGPRPADMDDLEGELQLRDEPYPVKAAQEAWDVIRKAAAKRGRALLEDPDAAAEMGREIREEIDALFEKSKKPNG